MATDHVARFRQIAENTAVFWVRERIGQLGGRLDVASSDHGTTGTTVRVWLPLAKAAG